MKYNDTIWISTKSGYEISRRGAVVFYMDLGNVCRFYADIAKSPLPEPNGTVFYIPSIRSRRDCDYDIVIFLVSTATESYESY